MQRLANTSANIQLLRIRLEGPSDCVWILHFLNTVTTIIGIMIIIMLFKYNNQKESFWKSIEIGRTNNWLGEYAHVESSLHKYKS